jgi:zinc and cadmium transporter
MPQLLLYGLIAGLFSLIGGLLVLWKADYAKRIITPLLSFSAGAFLGVSFLDLLPESVESVDEPHAVFIAFLVGLTVFFALERFLMKYAHNHPDLEADHSHNHADHTETLPSLIILGDTLHNFLDGAIIALAYIANPAIGLVTTLAVAAHEIPQEIGDFVILLDQGWSKKKIILTNILSSLATILGILIAYYLTSSLIQGWLPYLLAGVSGIFTYIALSDLVPEIHHRARHKSFFSVLTAFVIGLLLVGYLVSLTH